MAWLAVDKDGQEYLYLNKPERYTHYNVFKSDEIDFEIWTSGGDNLELSKGSIEKLMGRKLTWNDEPVEI